MRKLTLLAVTALVAISGCAGVLPNDTQTTTPEATTPQPTATTTQTPTTTTTTASQTVNYTITQGISEKNSSNYQVAVKVSERPPGQTVSIVAPDFTVPIVTADMDLSNRTKQITIVDLSVGDTIELRTQNKTIETYTVHEQNK